MSLLHDDNSSSINKYPSGTKGDPLICVSFYPEDIEKDKADKSIKQMLRHLSSIWRVPTRT